MRLSLTDSPAGSRSFALWPALACVGIAIFFMAVAAAFYLPTPRRAFMSDGAPVPWLSSAQLWSIAMLCLVHAAQGTLSRLLSAWLCVAMLVLAFDEQFMLHEWWKFGCVQWLAACEWRVVKELPIILVAVLGVGTAFWLHRELGHRTARRWLWSAIGVGVFAVLLDLKGVRYVGRYEEAFEVLAESLFLGMLIGLRR
jgi:hypothetical protein